MEHFSFHLPTHVLFGKGLLRHWIVPSNVRALGHRAMVVTGKSSVRSSGSLDVLLDGLEKAGIRAFVFEGIEANPSHQTINTVGQQAREADVDFVLGIGGGSALDAAKCVAVLARNPTQNCWELTAGQPRANAVVSALPIVAIPTTAATGSEVTPFAVVSNYRDKSKSTILHDRLKPQIAILDPELTITVPANVTADGAADIMSHVLESYICGGSTSIVADRYAEAILLTVMENAAAAIEGPADIDARSHLQWSAALALNGLQKAGRPLCGVPLHNMEHALSGQCPHLSHGRGLAVLYPAFFTWMINHGRAIDKFARLGRVLLGVNERSEMACAQAAVTGFSGWLASIGLLQTLSDVAVPDGVYREAAAFAIRAFGKDGAVDAAGPFTAADMVEVFTMTADNRRYAASIAVSST